MKERPLLMYGPMVVASLREKNPKTQTRRIMTPQPWKSEWIPEGYDTPPWQWHRKHDNDVPGYTWKDDQVPCIGARECPYGVPGDRLWVRERHRIYAKIRHCDFGAWVAHVEYADGVRRAVRVTDEVAAGLGHPNIATAKWRPSIHMPRWACRLVLEVVSVRVERLQAISETDAIAEGFDASTCAAVFDAAAGKGMDPQDACYVSYDYDTTKETESDGWHCRECAKKLLKTPADRVCSSGRVAPECDGPASCEDCGVPLLISLTEYGIDRELYLDDDRRSNVKFYAASGADAAIIGMVAGGIGDLRPRHLPRLAQIGFATAIDQLNGKGTWKANPWVWVVVFRAVPT